MEKRIELEKRGKKPGDVRQPSNFTLLLKSLSRFFPRFPSIYVSVRVCFSLNFFFFPAHLRLARASLLLA